MCHTAHVSIEKGRWDCHDSYADNADKYEKIEDKYTVLCMPASKVFASIDAAGHIPAEVADSTARLTARPAPTTLARMFIRSCMGLVNCMRPGRRGKATAQGIPMSKFQTKIMILLLRMYCNQDGQLRHITRKLPVRRKSRKQPCPTPREPPDPPYLIAFSRLLRAVRLACRAVPAPPSGSTARLPTRTDSAWLRRGFHAVLTQFGCQMWHLLSQN